MTPVFSARRRADEFDSLIEGRSTGSDATRYAEFVEVVEQLRSVPAPEARPEFVTSLREQLMLAAPALLTPSASEAKLALPVRKPMRERRLAAAVGGLAIVGATTSMAMAAQSALPGDVLYPLKRAIENAEAGISVNDGQRGATMLANATGRLDEVTALSREGRVEDTTAIAETLNTFTEQATVAADLLLSDYESTGHESSIAELRDFTAESMETLAALEGVVPGPARDELIHAASVLTQIDNEAAQACPQCGGAGITEIPAILTASDSTIVTAVTPEPVQQASAGDKPSGGKKDKPESTETEATGGTALPGLPSTGGGTEGEQGGNGGSGGGDDSGDPISDLTDGLTGGGSSSTSNGGTGIPGLPTEEASDTVDDLTDPLTGDN